MGHTLQGLKTGNLVWRQMVGNPLFNHYGVYLNYEGYPFVIHKNSTSGQRITTLEEFLKGYPLRGTEETRILAKILVC